MKPLLLTHPNSGNLTEDSAACHCASESEYAKQCFLARGGLMGNIIWLIVMVPVSMLFTCIGVFAWKRDNLSRFKKNLQTSETQCFWGFSFIYNCIQLW